MPLVSKKQRRNRDVTEADFESVPQISEAYALRNSKKTTASLITLWNKHVHYMPKDFVDLFDGLLQSDDEFHISSLSTSKIQFNVCVSGARIPFFTRSYNLDEPHIEFSNISLPFRRQGKGIGTQLAVAGIDMSVMIGVSKAIIEATSTMGSYAWLKKRYKLCNTISVFEDKNQRLSKLAMAKLSSIKPLVPPEDFEMAMTLAESFTTQDAQALADMDFDILEPIRQARLSGHSYDAAYFDTALRQYFKAHQKDEEEFEEEFIETQAQSMARLVIACKAKKLPLTIGKMALAGGAACMMVDYQDDAHITEVINNMGSFRNSVVVPAAQQCQLG